MSLLVNDCWDDAATVFLLVQINPLYNDNFVVFQIVITTGDPSFARTIFTFFEAGVGDPKIKAFTQSIKDNESFT